MFDIEMRMIRQNLIICWIGGKHILNKNAYEGWDVDKIAKEDKAGCRNSAGFCGLLAGYLKLICSH